MDIIGAGLVLVAIGWLIQLAYLIRGNKEIQPLFIVFYLVGVSFLVVNNYLKHGIIGAIFEISTLITSAVVLVAILVRRKTDS